MKKNTTTNQSLSADVSACKVIAVDLAKRVFQVAGEDALGLVVYENRIKSREAFHAFLRKLPATVTVLMETGPGAQAWARLLQAQGNCARILPAQHVANHRSGPKTIATMRWLSCGQAEISTSQPYLSKVRQHWPCKPCIVFAKVT